MDVIVPATAALLTILMIVLTKGLAEDFRIQHFFLGITLAGLTVSLSLFNLFSPGGADSANSAQFKQAFAQVMFLALLGQGAMHKWAIKKDTRTQNIYLGVVGNSMGVVLLYASLTLVQRAMV